VARQPDVFRFMLHSHFTQRSDDTGRALQSARQSAERAAALFAGAVDDESVRVADAELVIYSIFGGDEPAGAARDAGRTVRRLSQRDHLRAGGGERSVARHRDHGRSSAAQGIFQSVTGAPPGTGAEVIAATTPNVVVPIASPLKPSVSATSSVWQRPPTRNRVRRTVAGQL
jgi:hypothetical protein